MRGRGGHSLGPDARVFNDPALAVAAPFPFAVAPLGVELPGANLPGQRIPADPLVDRQHRLALHLDGEGPDQEIAILRPSASDPDMGVRPLIDPLADHPFQLLEPVVRGNQRVGFLADARDQPATIAPDQQGRVPARFGRPLGRRDHGAALGLDHVGTEELDRVGIDLQLHSRAGGEGLGQTLLDQGMTAVPCAVFLDDLRVLGEPGDQGLGVCLVVVANESVIGQADRLLLRRRLRLAGSLPRRGICWFSILSRGEANAAEDQACP